MVAAITSLSHRYYSSTSAQVYGTFTDRGTDTKVQKSTITEGSSTTPPPTNFEPMFSVKLRSLTHRTHETPKYCGS